MVELSHHLHVLRRSHVLPRVTQVAVALSFNFYKSQFKTALNPTLMSAYFKSRNTILKLVVFVTSRRVRSILPSKQNPLVDHAIELYGHQQ